MSNICAGPVCPIILDSTCVFYSGANLIYTGIRTNDSLQVALIKIDNKFRDSGIGYAFQNGIIQSAPGQPVKLGGSLVEDTIIDSQSFNLTVTGNLTAGAHVTSGGTSSQFVKGDGSLDNGPYQPGGNYITDLTGDGTASGPGSAAFTLDPVSALYAGTWGTSSTVPRFTLDTKGRITAVTNTAISLPPTTLVFGGDVYGSGIAGSTINLTISDVLTSPGTYGSSTRIPVLTVNSKGQVTGISDVAFGAGSGTVTSVSVTPGTGISASVANPTTAPNITITNTAPDQTVVLSNGTGISVTGTYPNFTISATGGSTPSLQQVVNVGNGISNFGGLGNASIQSTNFTNGRTLYLNDNAFPTIRLVDNANASNFLQIDIDTLNIDGVSYNWSSIVNPPTSPLVALPFTTDHITATNNPYLIGDVVWYLGNVYRCIANNDSILPTNASYWTNLGAGYPLVQQPSDWNSTSGNNQILNKPTIPTGTVTGVTATSPITSSGGTAPVISTSMATNRLIGRTTVGVGVMEEITVGTGLTLSGGTLSATAQVPGFEMNFLLMGA
jgi:hypothetical protein